jgi:hypothetical protein
MQQEHEPVEFKATILPDGRANVVVTYPNPRYAYMRKVYSYTTVRNIDGSNRLMEDGAYWTFLPYELSHGAYAAIAAAKGERYMWAHCVPSWAIIL